jgi:hypothetical protein
MVGSTETYSHQHAPGQDGANGSGNLAVEVAELRAQMGEHIAPFGEGGVDGFLSHFILTIQFLKGPMRDQLMHLTMPTAVQTVSRSNPFIYQGREARHEVRIPLPEGCTLPDTITDDDFLTRPEDFFQEGQEAVWMQILNLDARMEDTPLGPMRIILGETLKREYPDLFQPSLGVAESLGKAGFPAKLFFNPIAVIQTKFGDFRAKHGTLAYGRVVAFPPVNTPVSIRDAVPMELVQDIRALGDVRADVEDCQARIIALSHPIDVSLQIPGNEAFGVLEGSIKASPWSYGMLQGE